MADANSKVFVNDDSAYNKEIKAVPTPEKEIGIDTKEYIFQNIINAGTSSVLDIGEIESFSMASKSRDQVYRLLDTMAEDSAIAAVLETYAEDATEYNDQGKIVWVEASNSNIASYVNYLLKTLCVDKNIYGWVYSLCKYGDLYLRLYRTSDYTDLLFDPKPENKLDEKIDTGEIVDKSGKEPLNEAVKIRAYAKSDKYVRYIEMVPNPAEVFELTRFGKTAGYIQVDLPRISSNSNFLSSAGGYYRYKFNRGDINLYSATEFVHACLEDNSSRVPEEVDIFVENYEKCSNEIDSNGNITKSKNTSSGSTMSYKVKRGQSLLYSVYKVWRELMLLENSVLLNRVTKSSIVRVIGVEVGDMPKEMVGPHLQGIKQMIEQKAAIDVGVGMGEYTNPGPIENNIYVPTHGGVGAISTQQIGGDVDVKGLADLDYYLNKFYGTLRVPKQYFCLRGNTPILLLNGKKITIEEMYNHRDEYIGKGIMGCSADGKLDPTIIKNVMLTNPSTGFVRIHLDNGEYVDVTSNHRMMLRDGTFVNASDVQLGDSLMPYYDTIRDGRRYVLDNLIGKFLPQYRVVAESVADIPPKYQVHHKNRIKIDDDFGNLEPLSVAEHYQVHCDELHGFARASALNRSLNGVPHGNVGKKAITNGVEMRWLSANAEMPDGFTYGMPKFSDSHRDKISKALKGIKHNYNNFVTYHDKCIEKMKRTKDIRRSQGLYDEQYKKQSQFCKDTKVAERLHEAHMASIPENRKAKERYVRCLTCGSLHKIRVNDDWYNEYLNKDRFWYCSSDCALIDGRGKLSRSYKLLESAGFNGNQYEVLRHQQGYRPDNYFKYTTLRDKVKHIIEYVPECNHKVVGIEYIDVAEPAYDIEVASDNHTFALPCGIFVHNCQTDDSTGFNGGTSLSIISSRYAKMIKRIQNTVIQALTDAVNLMLLDSGLDSYVNNFTLRMQSPTTQEEKDRQENTAQRVQLVSDVMNLVADIENPIVKLKMLKSLLANAVTNTEITTLLNSEIQKMEQDERDAVNDEVTLEDASLNDAELGDTEISGDEPLDLGIGVDDTASADTSMEVGIDGGISDTSSESASLPTPDELGVDMTAPESF